jgi:hypothetical protein
MEKNVGDKPVWFIIHIYMEVSQGNSLSSYLDKQRCLFFFLRRSEEQVFSVGLVSVGLGRMWREGVGG